jgi:hypothetical protein
VDEPIEALGTMDEVYLLPLLLLLLLVPLIVVVVNPAPPLLPLPLPPTVSPYDDDETDLQKFGRCKNIAVIAFYQTGLVAKNCSPTAIALCNCARA